MITAPCIAIICSCLFFLFNSKLLKGKDCFIYLNISRNQYSTLDILRNNVNTLCKW